MIFKTVTSKIISVLFLVICISLIASTCIAATYYVDKGHSNASDSNSGTEANPFKTFQRGVDVAVAGDTVLIKAGTYFEAIDLKNSGSQGAPITFSNYKNDVVYIDGANSSDSKLIHWNADGRSKHYIVWDGINVRNGTKRGLWIDGDHNIIRNSKVHDIGGEGACIIIRRGNYNTISNCETYRGFNGIEINDASYTTIEGNIVYDNINHTGIDLLPFPNVNGDTSELGSNKYIWTNNVVRNNIVYNNVAGIYSRHQENSEISGNLLYDNIGRGIHIHRCSTNCEPVIEAYESNSEITNNTIVNNGDYGIYNSSAANLNIRNNIFAHNVKTDVYMGTNTYGGVSASSGHRLTNNLYYDTPSWNYNGNSYYSLDSFKSATGKDLNGIQANPGFLDSNNNDYNLTSSSIAIDKGIDLSSEGIHRDLNGTLRPEGQGYDIGAYEFKNSQTDPPKVPLNLRIVN